MVQIARNEIARKCGLIAWNLVSSWQVEIFLSLWEKYTKFFFWTNLGVFCFILVSCKRVDQNTEFDTPVLVFIKCFFGSMQTGWSDQWIWHNSFKGFSVSYFIVFMFFCLQYKLQQTTTCICICSSWKTKPNCANCALNLPTRDQQAIEHSNSVGPTGP